METAYVLARGWGIGWKDFMDLPIPMWWLEFDENFRANKEIENASSPGFAGYSNSEWDKAIKAHREKMRKKDAG